MLNAQQHAGFGARWQSHYAIDMLTELGMLSDGGSGSLALCLDAADPRSYPGSGQTWFDMSGNGRDFFVGVTSGAEASDPTFTGNAGDPGAYFAFDGGDFMRKASANDSFFDGLHKNSACWMFMSVCQWDTDATDTVRLIGTSGVDVTKIGVLLTKNGTGGLTLNAYNGSGSLALGANSTNALSAQKDKWHFLGIGYDEAVPLGTFIYGDPRVSGENILTAYSSPSASAASFTAEVGAGGNGASINSAGTRMSLLLGWSMASGTFNGNSFGTKLGLLYDMLNARRGYSLYHA